MAPARRPIDNISMPAAAASASSAGDGPPLPPPSAPAGPSSSGPRAPGIDDAAGADARKKKLAMRQAKTRERKEPKEKGAAKGFVFIESDPSQKHSEDTRRSIRSHVMLGKNKTRQPRVKARQSSWIGANDKTGREQGPSSRETALQMRRNMTVSEGKNAEAVLRISPASPVAGPSGSSEEDEANSVILIRPSRGEPSVPPSICHDLRTFAFAEELSSDHISLLAKHFTSIRESQYPLPGAIEYDSGMQCWFYWTAEDAAYLNMILCATSMFSDIDAARRRPTKPDVLQQVISRNSRYHLNRTLTLLSERLKNYELALTDSSFASVTSLSILADFLEDASASRAHAAGLRQMVRLRGGIASLSHNCHLQAKICRADLQSSIATGDRPQLFDENISWDSFWEGLPERDRPLLPSARLGSAFDSPSQPPLKMPPGGMGGELFAQLDPRLVTVYSDMHEFARLVNFLPQLGRKLKATLFSEFMISAQYRILNLSYPLAENPLAECVRVGLLVFSCPIFLQMPGMRVQYSNLFQRFRAAVGALDGVDQHSSLPLRRFKFWMLVVGAIVVFSRGEEWLLPALRQLVDPEMATKEKALAALKEILWVQLVFDRPGQVVLEMVFEEGERVTEGSPDGTPKPTS